MQEHVLFPGTPILTFENKLSMFKKIVKIIGMKVDDGFVSCRKLEGVFTCIAVNDITKTTIYLQNVYLSIETMKQDPNNLEILNFIKQVKLIENIDKLLYLECIKIIARNLSVDKYGSFLDNIINNHLAISSLNNFLINADADTTIISSNYGLKIWYPFQNNVSGITLYDNFRNTPLIKEIYMNMSYNMNTSGALLSAYVPGEVLYDLTYELSYSRKKEIKIIMLFIKMNNNLRNEFQVPHNVTYLIGIAIPKLCKMNYLPMIYASLTSYTNNLTLWSQFGANYFDRVTYPGYRCIFDQISYFGKADDYEYNSLRNAYCLVSTFDKISFKNISWVVPVDQPIFPPYLCVKKNYDIMSTYCLLDTPREIYVDYTCLDDFSVSNQTELLYQQYVACVYNRNECLNSFIYCHNFIDVLLQNNMLWMKGGSNLLGINNSSVIIKCLEKISLYVPDDQKVLYTSVLLELVDFSELHIPLDSAYKHIIIENVRMNDGAVYWKNTFEPLSNYSISDINFMPEPHVSALAFLEKYELFNSRIDFIVIDSIKLNYSGDCRSDIIGVKVMCEFCDFINFTIFLRITYGKYTNWGYWYWVTVEKGTMTLFCIAEQGHGCKISASPMVRDCLFPINISEISKAAVFIDNVLLKVMVMSPFKERTFTFGQKLEMFEKIAAAVDMEVNGSFLSCQNVRGIFTCIEARDITLITTNLYQLYLNLKYEKLITNITELKDFTMQTDLTRSIDEMLYIKCMQLIASRLPVQNYQIILNAVLKSNSLSAINCFMGYIDYSLTIANSFYVLHVWNPFQTNVTGFTLRKSSNIERISLKEIYLNESSSNINTTAALIAVYIPSKWIHDTRSHISTAITNKIRALPDSAKHLIGVVIPGSYKRNFLPMLNVYFSEQRLLSSQWIEFGKRNFDKFPFLGHDNILSEVTYISNIDQNENELIHRKYCVVSSFNKTLHQNISWLIPIGEPIFLPYLCIDQSFRIFSSHCSLELPEDVYIDYNNCYQGYVFSKNVELLYQRYVVCQYQRSNCDGFLSSDINLISNILDSDLVLRETKVDNGTTREKKYTTSYSADYHRIAYVSFILSLLNFSQNLIKSAPNFSYYRTEQIQADQGFMYEKGSLIPIAERNYIRANYVVEEDIIAITALSEENAFITKLEFLIISNHSFKGNCRTVLVGIKMKCDQCTTVKFAVFFRLKEGLYSGWGYWYEINISSDVLTMLCIIAIDSNPCSSDSKLLIFERKLSSVVAESIERIDFSYAIISIPNKYVHIWKYSFAFDYIASIFIFFKFLFDTDMHSTTFSTEPIRFAQHNNTAEFNIFCILFWLYLGIHMGINVNL
ncbi:hypothetical protein QE152_g30056 [Popillia japonica]|uniref:Uncharacterized protein n=1 Tax=Popillia japonica TaxID=7064 RepID=A0AAW1JFT8_POPJA